jgi:ornithine cyclodeaminase/alanine dehydrogenase-like protein (mu-crystallin family)
MKTGRGWLRVGPAALEGSGWMGFKAMNLVPGAGVRYQVHLYEIASGALLAIMDAQHLTTLRTGATSAVATRRLARPGSAVVALLGSGVEARAQLEAMQTDGKVRAARVFSPTAANREALATDFRQRFEMDIAAVASAEEAVGGADLILAAVKSTEPVLFGRWLRPGVHVNSVGTARRDQREIDVETFERSARIIVDTKEGVFGEAGDAFAARERVRLDEVDELARLVTDKVSGRRTDSEITLFKSVGTGLQDIAVAALIYQRAVERSVGTELGEFPYLKRN